MTYNATEHHTRVMADLLLAKEAEDVPTNLKDDTVGVNPDQAPDPGDDGEGTIDALWGEENAPKSKKDAVHLSDAALEGIVQNRTKMLEELFDSKKPAESAEKKLLGQQLTHAASGEYETSAPLLAKSAADRTLAELTRGILD